MNAHHTRYFTIFLIVSSCLAGLVRQSDAAERPNIIWIIVEDMSAHFSCYGEKTIRTPHVDALAKSGVRFTQAFVTAPVCSTGRSALITGMYQTSIGAHHHRSGRGAQKINLPQNMQLVPELFRAAGYHTSNGGITNRGQRIGKTDYNFQWSASAYDGNDWSGRKKDQPFFSQIQLRGGKLRHGKTWHAQVAKTIKNPVTAADVTLPPYYPNDSVIRSDWADYLNTVTWTDNEVGRIVARLKKEGVYENTCLFFITDHGISHVRGKQFCYEEGMRIPMIVTGPKMKAGSVRDDLVVHIDMAASSLAMAEIPIPKTMQSVDLFAADYKPRDFIVSARDRCDETVDHIRAVRTARYKYIRNYLPKRPYLQPNAYKDHKPVQIRMRELHAAGKLNSDQSLIMATRRPLEELYDLDADPHELNNLADESDHRETLRRLSRTLEEWVVTTHDQGAKPEAAAMYDSDMQVYLNTLKQRRPDRLEIIKRNIALMKKWAAERK
jgi:arylsulfatase A-like enzyme